MNKAVNFTFRDVRKEKKVHFLNISTGIMRFLKSVTLNIKRHGQSFAVKSEK